MALNTTSTGRGWLPDAHGDLVVTPVSRESVALQALGGPVTSPAQTNRFRIPIVAADPSAAYVAEGAEIPLSDATLSEVSDVFHKLAGLSVISRELADDSSPAAAEQIGQGLARDIAKKLDANFFGAGGLNAPVGLEDLAGVTVHTTSGTAWTDTDAFVSAIYGAEGEGATLGAFVANPADALALAQLREADTSNKHLLQPDPTQPLRRLLAGIPLLVSPSVTAGTVWGMPGEGRLQVCIREDVRIDTDGSAYFSSDQVAVRATLRHTNLCAHEASVQKVMLAAA